MPAGKTASTKATTRKKKPVAGASTVSRSRKKAGSAVRKSTVSPEQRYRMIQESAYYLAEKSGFTGDNLEFWLEAERQIDNNLNGG